ncbi:MAG: hypothetical protein BRC29_02215 [Nanohaloarchaea archaeon SW_7_43_1]|nr:MAG: hypothetical protein BRC29_02215 [Nanohaloarchaea archaeon SW_7_43_1]
MSEPEIASTEDNLGGEPRLKDTRIGVSHIVQYYENGWSIDKISRELELEPLQVVKALEFYYRHPQEIRGIIRDRKSRESSLENEKAAAEKA